MKFAVVQFPGSNCDFDCYDVLGRVLGQEVRYAWHKDTEIAPDEVVVLPGGFSYGDYLRSGAIASHSPIMKSVIQAAESGQKVIGICNGFQVLCETGLLPGALIKNDVLQFRCAHVGVRCERPDSPFTTKIPTGSVLQIPIAHGDGCYVADEDVVNELEREGRVLFRYVDEQGRTKPEANPNGSVGNIAGICNRERNVLGMMPHPERACESVLGSEDGLGIFESLIGSA